MISEPTLVAVPNISEGVDPALIERLAASDVLLDVHSDAIHNRSVITYGGDPSHVVSACRDLLRRCVDALDIRGHRGVHPRNGVVDVLPIVPYASPEEAARDAALEVAAAATSLDVPVYLYERALDPPRPLPVLRRALLQPTRPPPDLGPDDPHPSAGVVCIGVRDPLIAFNVTVEAEAATLRKIARHLRTLPAIRALPFPDQISMNLIDPRRTGPLAAFRAVEAAAHQEGANTVGACEIVGLVPGYVLAELDELPLVAPVRSIDAALEARL